VISTNAGGTAVLRFGNTRAFVLGLEVVVADGRVWNGLRGLRKDNTGYDLKQLFIGAEGTLGIVTAAVLALHPAPRSRATAWVGVADVAAAVRLLATLRAALSARLVGFELVSAQALAISRRYFPEYADPLPGVPWSVLVELEDSGTEAALAAALEAALAEALEAGDALDAAIAGSLREAAAMWALRENIAEAQRREGPNLKHDIALPVSAVPEFLDYAGALLDRRYPGVRFVVFGHLGDGNLHYNLSPPPGFAAEAFLAEAPQVARIVHDEVAARRGSISAEHGIGQLKRDELVRHKAAVELDLMRSVKAALDPRGLLNPGKVL
jgi:FAD/FMN-containing dehydrogenase